MPRKLRVEYPGAMYHLMSRRETAEASRAPVGEELGRLGWQEADLRHRRKTDRAKLALAAAACSSPLRSSWRSTMAGASPGRLQR